MNIQIIENDDEFEQSYGEIKRLFAPQGFDNIFIGKLTYHPFKQDLLSTNNEDVLELLERDPFMLFFNKGEEQFSVSVDDTTTPHTQFENKRYLLTLMMQLMLENGAVMPTIH